MRTRFPMKQIYKRRNQTRVLKTIATVETCNGIVNMYVYDMTMRRPSKTPRRNMTPPMAPPGSLLVPSWFRPGSLLVHS